MGRQGRQEPARDRLPPCPRAFAGFHRCAGGGRSGRNARCDHFAGRRCREDQPAQPGGSGHRPFGDDRRIRQPARLPDERGPRIRAQHGALYLPQVGSEGLQQLPRGAPRHRHLPSGEPGVSEPDRLDRYRSGGQDRGLSRHAGGHRQPHHHGQRGCGSGLGRRRDRGRSRDAGPADFHADPRSRRV